MMTLEERKAYGKTDLYRMIFILSGFRKLIHESGSEIVNAIRNIWARDGERHEEIDGSFILLVDLGCIKLGEEEIKAYFDFIYKAYDFPPHKKERAYSNLVQYAKLHPFEDDPDEIPNGKRALLQAYAITNLNELLK